MPSPTTPAAKPAPIAIAGAPRGPLTPAQQLEALRRVQAQAEQRVKLGVQLFKAAEARLGQHQDVLAEARAEGEKLREQIQTDVAKSLQQYDQWIGGLDEQFTRMIRELFERVEKLEGQVAKSQGSIETLIKRAEALLDQARYLIERPAAPAAAPQAFAPVRPAPTAPPPQPIKPLQRPGPVPPRERNDAAAPAPAPTLTPHDKLYSNLLRRLRPDGTAEAA